MREKAVTLSDIAQKLNFSTVTISKALRDHPDISTATKKLVRQAAEELGYTPNIMARNLSARRSRTIGVVIPKIAHFFFSSIIEHIYHIAFANNYEIILTVSQENAEREKRHIQTLLAMKVDGIIVSITQETRHDDIFRLVQRRGVPLVFMDRIPVMEGINRISVDDRAGARLGIEHAISLGYRRIGHLSGYVDVNIGRDRKQGFLDAMEAHSLPVNTDWVLEGGFGEEYGYDAFMRLHRARNLPDLLFTVTYPVALGVYSAAREVGARIPEDIDVLCFGNAKMQEFLSPRLSCIDQNTAAISKGAMDMIFEIIQQTEPSEPKSISIPTSLVLRQTCSGFKTIVPSAPR
jgi:LacI family transcriptional regulator